MKKITILMSTYNGQKYLEKQLNSIYDQKGLEDFEVQIVVRDDGSQDDTVQILESWSDRISIIIYRKNNVGARESFYWLIKNAPKSDYYAFCDQDDIWKNTKLSTALKALKAEKSLYFSNVDYIDGDDQNLGKKLLSDQFSLSLERVFMCNPANGCTMVWDHALHQDLLTIPYDTFTMHDEFLCIVALVKGSVVYDAKSSMSYRLHGMNVTQSNSLKKKYKIWKQIWFGRKPYAIDKRARMLLQYGVKDEVIPILLELGDYKKGMNRFQVIIKYHCEEAAINRSFKLRILLGLA